MFRVLLPRLQGILSRRRRDEPASRSSKDAILLSPSALAFVGASLGCLATLHLSALGIAPGIASALAATLLCGQVLIIRSASLLPGELFTSIYGGTFGGMTQAFSRVSGDAQGQPYLKAGVLCILLSAACGLAFAIIAAIDRRSPRPIASGFGGRSGAIAALACFVFLQLISWRADGGVSRDIVQLEFDTISASLICFGCLTGTFATQLALQRWDFNSEKQADRTFVAAAVALFGLVALQLIGLDGVSDAFYAGCFLGMSTPERLRGQIVPVLGAVLLGGVLVQVKRFLPGVGGSLGLAAFVTVAILVTLNRITALFAFRDETLQPPSAAHAVAALVKTSQGGAGFDAGSTSGGFLAARSMRSVAAAGLALLSVSCLLLPSQGTQSLDTTALAQSDDEKPSPTLVSLETNAAVGNDNRFEAPSVAADDSNAKPEGARAKQAFDVNTQPAEEPATASPLVEPDVTTLAPSGPDLVEETDVATDPNRKLFNEFRQWRAARFPDIAAVRPQPPRRSRKHTQVAAIAGSAPRPRAEDRGPEHVTPPTATGSVPAQRVRLRRPAAKPASGPAGPLAAQPEHRGP